MADEMQPMLDPHVDVDTILSKAARVTRSQAARTKGTVLQHTSIYRCPPSLFGCISKWFVFVFVVEKKEEALATYPKTGADAVTLMQSDIDRIAPEELLNDTIIDYWMRYLRLLLPSLLSIYISNSILAE